MSFRRVPKVRVGVWNSQRCFKGHSGSLGFGPGNTGKPGCHWVNRGLMQLCHASKLSPNLTHLWPHLSERNKHAQTMEAIVPIHQCTQIQTKKDAYTDKQWRSRGNQPMIIRVCVRYYEVPYYALYLLGWSYGEYWILSQAFQSPSTICSYFYSNMS